MLKATEDFDSSIDWNKLPSTDAPTVSGGITDPNGGSDAQRINFTANKQARVQQRVSLSASTQYTFSVYARVNTGTENFRLRNVTLSEAEGKTATTSWTRFEYTFTTTTGGNYDLSIQNSSNDARTVEFWGAMLNVGASANAYVKVDPSISGSTPTPAYSGFGDTYGDVTAYYSLRKFTEAETLNAIRVRRSSDDTEQDIGFDANGDLDTTALLAFVGTGGTDNGFVTTFYDQSGNGNDATNSTESEQPLVVSGGTLVTENSKAAIQFDGVDDYLSKASPVLGNSISNFTSFVAAKYDAIGLAASALFGARNGTNYGTSNSWVIARQLSGDDTFVSNNSGGYANAANDGATTLNQTLFYHQFIGGSQVASGRDGGVLSTNTTSIPANVDLSSKFEIGAITAPSIVNPMDGKIQELIVFNSDQSTNRTGMETNINDHFDIYTP